MANQLGKVTIEQSEQKPKPNPPNPNINVPASELDVVDVINTTSLLAEGQSPAAIANVSYGSAVSTNNVSQQNALSNQQGMNGIGFSVVGRIIKEVQNIGPMEARSSVDVLTNNELAQTIADLRSVVSAFQTSPLTPINPGTGTLIKTIEEVIAFIEDLVKREAAFSGDGSYENPLSVSDDEYPLFINLPFVLGIQNTTVSQISFGSENSVI